MLNEAKLSHQFWEDSISTSNYVHNILSHKGIKIKIPFEAIYKSKVNYENLLEFGCKVFFYISKMFRKIFDDNTLPGFFLGYSENPYAYKILDITNNTVIISRKVEFFELCPGNNYLESCPTDFTNFIPNNEIRRNSTYFHNNTYYSNINSNSNKFNQYLNTDYSIINKYNEIFKPQLYPNNTKGIN